MKKIYLATTSQEDLWELDKKIVFLGEWCLLYERRSFWEPLEGQLMGSCFETPRDVKDAFDYVQSTYERILPLLADALNAAHGRSYGLRYWRIVIGPWLQAYLSASYDRYSHIMRANEEFPSMTTSLLPEDSYTVPLDTLEFVSGLFEDSYNLQIYSKIFRSMGKGYPSKNILVGRPELYESLTKLSWKQKLINRCVAIYGEIISKAFAPIVVIKDSYFPRLMELNLSLRLFGRALFFRGFEVKVPSCTVNTKRREGLKCLALGSDSFSKCISNMLLEDIPQCFVENYNQTCHGGEMKYPRTTHTVFSANGWYYDEEFKCWAANASEQGSLLLGTPHGGDYGAVLNMFSVNHETSIVDYYYSWGWEREGCFASVVPMPSPKLMCVKEMGVSNIREGVLWVTTVAPRYLIEFNDAPSLFRDYLVWHELFLCALSEELQKEVIVRAHSQDNGWGVVSRLKELKPNIKFDTMSTPFLDSLDSCRLYVCDHLSTTFTEAIAANKPAILFWNPSLNELRPEAEEYFDLLRENGILYDSPEQAANAVNAIYNNVELWWNEPRRQSAVSVFRERFARVSTDALTLWTDELRKAGGSYEK